MRSTNRLAGLLAALCALLLSPALAQQQQPAQQSKPRVPPGRDPGGTAVAVIGSGINYMLPQIAQRLARDGEGDLIGLDLADQDGRPIERASGTGTTALAAIILREAGATRLVPVRTKPGDPVAHGKAAVLVARSPAAIALIAHTSTRKDEWEPFRQVAAHFPHVLYVVAAGDEGTDIDSSPHYPAALGAGNVLVVAGVDTNGKPFSRNNRGPRTIDVAVPVEGIETTGASGDTTRLWGSPAAAARMAALAARLLAVEPNLKGAELKQKILSHAKPMAQTWAQTRMGWIADAQRLYRLE